MQKNILITGKPRSGKSTLLRKLISDISNKVGFVTNEILGDSGRVGFEMETHTGSKEIIAHIDFETPYKVSRYFVNVQNLESMITEVSDFKSDDLLYLDEIAQMQLFSDDFKSLVLKYLDSNNTCVATLSCVYEDDFTENIKKRDDIILVEISPEDRDEKEKFAIQLLRKIEKAKRYVSEPERFAIKNYGVELHSEHGIRNLVFRDGKWNCDCDFFKQHVICSHTIATDQFVKM